MNSSLNSVWCRRLIAALLTWLVPFLIAVPYYGKNRTLLIDLMLFKPIMIVVATITTAMLMVWLLRAVTTVYTREAVITGLVWLVVNWVLDTIVLVGLLGMAPLDYITQIGVRYLMIPAMVIAAGLLLMIRLNNKSTGNSRTSVIWQWYSAITCASIRKIMQKSDLIENRSTKNFPICFKET